MNSSDNNPLIDVQTMLALRKGPNALTAITEKLRVKEMGPADHIRTKHEVKIFIESGTVESAKALARTAQERLKANEAAERRLAQNREVGQRLIQ
ncbi:MAG: hypothetical protein QM760_16065 [Nibricoccus sp.]